MSPPRSQSDSENGNDNDDLKKVLYGGILNEMKNSAPIHVDEIIY